jgi:serine/threonine-protein kinase RsbW
MYDHGVVDFKTGDKLIVATDGVLEAIPREIISGLSESSVDKSAQQTLAAIVDFVSRSIEITDDLTIVVFEAKIPKPPETGFRKTIKSEFKEVDKVVVEMNEFLASHAPGRFDWPMISVAIREALINAVEHGNKNVVYLPVDIDFDIQSDRLVVTVSDCGSGFDLATEKKRLAREGDLRIHGRGIEMMENISSSVFYLGGGIRLEFAQRKINR